MNKIYLTILTLLITGNTFSQVKQVIYVENAKTKEPINNAEIILNCTTPPKCTNPPTLFTKNGGYAVIPLDKKGLEYSITIKANFYNTYQSKLISSDRVEKFVLIATAYETLQKKVDALLKIANEVPSLKADINHWKKEAQNNKIKFDNEVQINTTQADYISDMRVDLQKLKDSLDSKTGDFKLLENSFDRKEQKLTKNITDLEKERDEWKEKANGTSSSLNLERLKIANFNFQNFSKDEIELVFDVLDSTGTYNETAKPIPFTGKIKIYDIANISEVKKQINISPQPIIFNNGESYFENKFYFPSKKNSIILRPKNSDIFKSKTIYRLEFYRGDNLKFTKELPYLDKATPIDTASDSKTVMCSTQKSDITILVYDENPDNDRISLKLGNRILIENQLIEKKQKYSTGIVHLNEGDNIFTLICNDAGTFRSPNTNQTSATVYICAFEGEIKDSEIDFDILFSAKPFNKLNKPYNRLIFKQSFITICKPKLIPSFLNVKKE